MRKVTLMAILIVILLFVVALAMGLSKRMVYTVVFDTQGGTIIRSAKVNKGNTVNKPNDPKKDGYTFDGWYLNKEVYDFTRVVNDNIVLKARWIKDAQFCNTVCQDGYVLNDDCICEKKETTTTKKSVSKSTKKSSTSKKESNTSYLEVGEEYVKIVEGTSVELDIISSGKPVYTSENSDIVKVEDYILSGIKTGLSTVYVKLGNISKTIKVNVISRDREKLETVLSTIKPLVVKDNNTRLLYDDFLGCKIINTANIGNKGTVIKDGIITHLNRSSEDEIITSSYEVKCGSERENIVLEHTVLKG